MKKYKCSVVIVQYNPIWEKLKRTLKSVIGQQECDYEIVIADDGSKNPCFDKTRDFLDKNGFCNYQLISNENNQGTVKNIISGLEVAQGKYVRVIAPGDMLYSHTTLQKIVSFMDEHSAKEVFGRMAFFTYDEGKINIINKQVPIDLEPYKKRDRESIKKHLFILGDNISGASYTWDRDYYLECLMRIAGRVIYLEDCTNAYTVYDGHDIYFMDEFVTWYEDGTGISTSKNVKWTAILTKDWISFFNEMENRYPHDSYIKRTRLYYQMSQKGFLLDKILKNILFIERYIFSRFMAQAIDDKKYEQVEKKYILEYFYEGKRADDKENERFEY